MCIDPWGYTERDPQREADPHSEICILDLLAVMLNLRTRLIYIFLKKNSRNLWNFTLEFHFNSALDFEECVIETDYWYTWLGYVTYLN